MSTDDHTNQSTNSQPSADDAPAPRYEIRVKGHLGSRWATWFDGMNLTAEDDGTTVIRGPVVDQAALHGLLQTLRDLALAGALLGDPQVLLLDEPSNGLDPDGIRWLRLYLTDFARSGRAVFVSSHLISELSMFAQHVTVEVIGDRLVVRGSTKAAVSQLAFDNGIRLLELSEIAPSLEDTLLDMTGASAEFARPETPSSVDGEADP